MRKDSFSFVFGSRWSADINYFCFWMLMWMQLWLCVVVDVSCALCASHSPPPLEYHSFSPSPQYAFLAALLSSCFFSFQCIPLHFLLLFHFTSPFPFFLFTLSHVNYFLLHYFHFFFFPPSSYPPSFSPCYTSLSFLFIAFLIFSSSTYSLLFSLFSTFSTFIIYFSLTIFSSFLLLLTFILTFLNHLFLIRLSTSLQVSLIPEPASYLSPTLSGGPQGLEWTLLTS